MISKLIKTKLESALSRDNSEAYIIWSASKIIVEKEWIFPTKEYTFEGLEVRSFNSPIEYLSRHYGNEFMTLPKEEDRRVGIKKIDILK